MFSEVDCSELIRGGGIDVVELEVELVFCSSISACITFDCSPFGHHSHVDTNRLLQRRTTQSLTILYHVIQNISYMTYLQQLYFGQNGQQEVLHNTTLHSSTQLCPHARGRIEF